MDLPHFTKFLFYETLHITGRIVVGSDTYG